MEENKDLLQGIDLTPFVQAATEAIQDQLDPKVMGVSIP